MNIYWLDLETTGLNPREGIILEIAIAQATLEDPTTLLRVCDGVVKPPSRELPGMIPFILEMHAGSGLLADVAKAEETIDQIEDVLLASIPEESDYANFPTLAGNSVHFDLEWLREHMPRLAQRFSHRVLDVSAINLFCRSLGMPKMEKFPVHRAGPDIAESIRQFILCRDWLKSR